MSLFSALIRAKVTQRAGHRCEYCHLPVRGQVATFPIDHIIPRNANGKTEIENLALSCPHCNAQKWKLTQAFDIETNEMVKLFHPRLDAWNDHFEWQKNTGKLIGRTSIGRATIAALQINSVSMVELRLLLSELLLFTDE